jgi:hypothetical protein
MSLPTPAMPPAFTLGTISGVAWALTLAQRIDTDDFVLGLIRSGRNLALPGVDKFMGPLTGLMPLRVKFSQDSKVHDLLKKYQTDWTESSEHDAYSWVELCDDTNSPAVKGAVATATTLNIVHHLDSDLDYEVEVPVKQEPTFAPSVLGAANPFEQTLDALIDRAATSLGPVRTPSQTSSDSESLLDTPPKSSTPTPPSTPGSPLKSTSLPNQEVAATVTTKHITKLLPAVIEKHLGASQKPINLNVILPRSGYDLKVMIRRDTTACTKEFANALVQSFGRVAEQLISVGRDVTVADLVIPCTRGVKASAWE